jgi:cytochrome d ubiquinol oxidase subunit II
VLFSGFYLPLLLILLALILRGVAFEFRHQVDDPRWKRVWDEAIFYGSLVPAVLWGVAFANLVRGVPIRDTAYVGTVLDLLHPYALMGGLVSLTLFTLHGATFLTLKTRGELADRANRVARALALMALVVSVGFLAWTYLNARSLGDTGVVPGWLPWTAIATVITTEWLARERYEGWAFAASGAGIVLIVLTLFLNLYPRVMVSSLGPAHDLTIRTASSGETTLTIMTIAALVFTPVVVAYQAWTYWVFRRRVSREAVNGPTTPIDAVAARHRGR